MNFKDQPTDIFSNNITKNEKLILVKDPKHTKSCYHYTIWLIDKNIKNILYLKDNHINDIKSFIGHIKTKKLFDNEKMYFTYPPSHCGFHVHILPKTYISHRHKEEIYYFEEVSRNFDNIEKINKINSQKKTADRLESKFKIGLLIINNMNKIHNIKTIIHDNNIDFVVVIRKRHSSAFIEELIENYKFINVHIHTEKLYLYQNMINYDLKLDID
jgi:hypothetical protein